MREKIRKSMEKRMWLWYFIPILVIILAVTLFFVINAINKEKSAFVFEEHLEETAFEINDTEVTLKEAAYYIMVIESNINASAIEYNTDNPLEYWNVYLNDGEGNSNFLRQQAKEDAMSSCVRDGIYYKEAVSAGIELDADEQKQCEEDANEQNKALTGKQQQVTGYEYVDMYNIIIKIAIIKKYMTNLMDQGYSEEELDVGGDYYENLKDDSYDVKINDELWEKVRLGALTIN